MKKKICFIYEKKRWWTFFCVILCHLLLKSVNKFENIYREILSQKQIKSTTNYQQLTTTHNNSLNNVHRHSYQRFQGNL